MQVGPCIVAVGVIAAQAGVLRVFLVAHQVFVELEAGAVIDAIDAFQRPQVDLVAEVAVPQIQIAKAQRHRVQ